ncbi:FtsW/RodA/SpoVE family cell cycle protein [Tellurirhabdus bombi]|uniref:FtsW/RodA/SpoVE family cell cycle protein n=1 Tax=Tellurirhabdus bombi TaxID=2907205 RepID=UPI001F2DA101|nr:FtsW/RodA/SpoVE family cell cycle protein [Tellurirhabdus bombi]
MENKPASQRREERLFLLGATALLLVLFVRLYVNLAPKLEKAEQEYASGNAINLQAGVRAKALRQLLTTGDYYTDKRDINLVVDSLPAKLEKVGKLENLGAINKNSFAIIAPRAWKSPIGGTDFQSRLVISRQRLGFDQTTYTQELTNAVQFPSTVKAGSGELSLSGKVLQGAEPMAGVRVQLKQHRPSADTEPEKLTDARTDADGRFSFTGLNRGLAYSVVPLKPGFEFGARRGEAELTASEEYTFKAQPHRIRLIGTVAYSELKDNKALTVRTPADFRSSFFIIAALFLLAFWVVHFIWVIRKTETDAFLLPVLMLLTGISLLILLSIQDPLQDNFHAWQTLQGVAGGLLGLVILSQINLGKFYTKWQYDFFFNLRKRATYKLQGWQWLAAAILLALLMLTPLGQGPEGSGVKVNLNLGFISFQPSEVTKYLLLFFFAGFFAANEERIRNYSDIRWRFQTSWGVMVGAAALMLLYLLLGDMGPALVVCFTFLLFYSIARGNLGVMLATGVGYGILLWFLPDWLATLLSVVLVAGYLFWKGEVRTAKWNANAVIALLAEAPVILLLVMAMFTFGDALPFVGDRLGDRKQMWLSQWNNDVYGGDHLAHGFWTLASGGFSGQGLGQGSANTMPAAHTDMILPSIGEELGWLGLVAVFLLFGILIHRTFLHARRAGQPFSFYLCAGIAIATGVQFMLIAGGSIGLLPLTGVAVPFLSYGKVSLIINLAAMGIVASIASRPGQEVQKEYIKTYYDPVLTVGISGFLVVILVLAGRLAWIQVLVGDEYIVKPARVIDRNRAPIYSYNPRIALLTRELSAGTIYDRNRLVLAASERSIIQKNQPKLLGAGLNAQRLEQLSRKRLRRYYPFEEQLFYWVGDFNTRLFWGQKNGYFAEAAHLSELRGFDTKPQKSEFITTRYKADRFSKPVQKSVTLVAYDYSALTDMLRAGPEGRKKQVDALKDRNKDVQLSIDAALQIDLQKAINASEFKNRRVSVVVLDATSGDVLASAINPLPNLQKPEELLLSEKEQMAQSLLVADRDLGMAYPTAPGSTAKVLTALAAFNKLGASAADVTYNDITYDEIIRKGNREQEPYNEPVDMKKAIVQSSNVYFIRIANEKKLDDELANLYLATGMNIDFVGGYSYNPDNQNKERILTHWRDSSFVVNRQFYERWRGTKRNRYNSEFSGLAWGQGQLTSTPAAMARMAGAIANKGILQPSRYVLERAGKPEALKPGQPVAKEAAYAEALKSFMIAQSNPPGGRQKISLARVAGKSGTPQRRVKGKERYDGWYVFFAPTRDGRSATAVCVRIELGDASANAVALANQTIAPILAERGYLGSF